MDIFYLTLKQMLMMFTLIGAGFFLRKKKVLPDNAGVSMARLETYAFLPAQFLFSMMKNCTVETFSKSWVLILYGFVLVMAAIALAYPLSALFVRKAAGDSERSYQKNIYKYSMTFANYGFMGNFIVLEVWGADMFYKYSLFTLTLSIVCHVWGMYILIPKDENASLWHNLKKGLFTPPIIATVIGIIIGLLDLSKFVPGFLTTAFEKAGSCQGPVAMLLAGFVIGGYNLKELISNKKVYLASAMRLVVIPAAMMLILNAFNVDKEVMILALVAFATPLGLNTIVFPAAYGGDSKTGASMAMISNVLAVATIPLMYLVFIVLI